MKNILFFLLLLAFVTAAAQNSKETTMEKRAKEFHRVIGTNDQALWKKFIQENFTKALIERPVRSRIQTNGTESNTTSATPAASRMDEKLKMFEQLHNDFGNSKVVSIKKSNDMADMTLESASGMKGNFNFAFENNEPYLIDRIGVEVSMQNYR